MEEDIHLIAMLVTRREAILVKAERLQVSVDALRDDARALNASLTVLGYDGALDVPKRPKNTAGLFGKRELARMCGDVLRKAPDGLTTREVTHTVIQQKGWDTTDTRFASAMVEKVARVLNRKKLRGTLEAVKRDGINVWLTPLYAANTLSNSAIQLTA